MWDKLGLVYAPDGSTPWALTHAFTPTSWMLDEERIRVYAAFLDSDRVGRVGFVDVSARDPRTILQVSAEPVLEVGRPGSFDDNGVNPLSIVEQDGRLYLYYVGWQLGVQVRYFLFVGLAVSTDGGERFVRHSEVPVLDRADGEMFVRTAAHVLRDGDIWRMWYIAGDGWTDVDGRSVPTYNMRYLESDDLTEWGRQGRVCLDLATPDEFGFGRPFVLKDEGGFKMWYSIRTRSKGYRLGYAESPDGVHWLRKDEELGLDVSPDGWDSEMVCFSCVQPTRYGTYLFYNGNNYGETGFGVARWRV